VCHGSVPGDFLLYTTIPIPKGNTNKTISANYRIITLSSVFGQLIDVLILLRYSNVLGSLSSQFVVQNDRTPKKLRRKVSVIRQAMVSSRKKSP